MKLGTLNPRNWFSAKPEDKFTNTAVELVVKWIQPQLVACGLTENDLMFSGRAGSTQSVGYIVGYAKAVHAFMQTNSKTSVNADVIVLASLSGIFFNDTFEGACQSYAQVQQAVQSHSNQAREHILMGIEDFEQHLNPKPWHMPGLVRILGV